MCGRFTVDQSPQQLEDFFRLLSGVSLNVDPDHKRNWQARYNIAPSQPILIVRAIAASDHQSESDCPAEEPESLEVETAIVKWGLIPGWSKDPAIGSKMINARSETAISKPSFRAAMKTRRCVIPVTGFYEWKAVPKSKKQPYYMTGQTESWLLFAGLWEHWTAPDGSEVETATILTTSANQTMASLHQRMPVILAPGCVQDWLNPEKRPDQLLHLLVSAAEDQLQMWPVTPQINSPSYQDCAAIRPVVLPSSDPQTATTANDSGMLATNPLVRKNQQQSFDFG